jgi:hypothetical protein
MRIALALALAPALLGQHLVGPLTYAKGGVVLAGRTTPWQAVASIEERSDVTDQADKPPVDTAAARFALGRWCRERGLEELAAQHFARALELDAAHEGARCALGRAPDLVARQRHDLAPLQFADWCRDRALVDEQWATLVALLAKDPYDRGAIARCKAVQERHPGETLLRPPFAGRWLGLVDGTGHHQAKCFAFFAIDFAMVDADGQRHRGTGKALTDWYGFDQPVLAAADGVVTGVEAGFDDEPPGTAGAFDAANYVEIEHRDGECTDYAHVRKGSVTVKVGDRVKAGDVIARVGNSGASGLPHLHFTMDTTVWVGTEGVVIGRPYRFGGCRLVQVDATPCAIELRAARPQEGWVLECPPPAK